MSRVSEIVAIAPDHIGGVMLWPDPLMPEKVRGCLLDTAMKMLPSTALRDAVNNEDVALTFLHGKANVLAVTLEMEAETANIGTAQRETTLFANDAAREKP